MLEIAYTALWDFLVRIQQRAASLSTIPRQFVPYLGGETRKRKEAETAQAEAAPSNSEKPEPSLKYRP